MKCVALSPVGEMMNHPDGWVAIHEPSLQRWRVGWHDFGSANVASFYYGNSHEARIQAESLAKAVAALPELLEACIRVVQCVDPAKVPHDVGEQLQAAIAKAEGR